MAMVEPEEAEETQEKPRRKTPIWLFSIGASLLVTVIYNGAKSAVDAPMEATTDKTTSAVEFETSGMAQLLQRQRLEAQARELEQVQQMNQGGPMAMAQGNGGPQMPSEAAMGPNYVAPTGAVPRYDFMGSGRCEELPDLKERLRCLDEAFSFETRKERLQQLAAPMTDDDDLFMGDEGEGSGGTTSEGGGSPRSAPSYDPFVAGALENMWQQRPSSEPEGPGSSNAQTQFYRSGGANVAPVRVVGNLQRPATRYWLQRGAVLPCAFISGMNSQLPGQVEAQITQNIYDSIDQSHLLFPSGTKAVGHQNSDTRQGQTKIQVAWDELHFPNGEFLEIGGMSGADAEGKSGIPGKVNRHWGQKLGLALMTSTINVSFHLAAPPPRTGTMQDAVAQGVGEGVIQTANEGLRQMMQIPDEIEVRPAQVCTIKVEQSLAFPQAYNDGKRWRR